MIGGSSLAVCDFLVLCFTIRFLLLSSPSEISDLRSDAWTSYSSIWFIFSHDSADSRSWGIVSLGEKVVGPGILPLFVIRNSLHEPVSSISSFVIINIVGYSP